MLVALAGCRNDRVLSPGRSFTLKVISGDVQTAPS